jgi:hypothetical protein
MTPRWLKYPSMESRIAWSLVLAIGTAILPAASAQEQDGAAGWLEKARTQCQDPDARVSTACLVYALRQPQAGRAGILVADACLRMGGVSTIIEIVDLRQQHVGPEVRPCLDAGISYLRHTVPKDAPGFQKYAIHLGQSICTTTLNTVQMNSCFRGITDSEPFRFIRYADGYYNSIYNRPEEFCKHTAASLSEDPSVNKGATASSTEQAILYRLDGRNTAKDDDFEKKVMSRLRTCTQASFDVLLGMIDKRAAEAVRANDPKAKAEKARAEKKSDQEAIEYERKLRQERRAYRREQLRQQRLDAARREQAIRRSQERARQLKAERERSIKTAEEDLRKRLQGTKVSELRDKDLPVTPLRQVEVRPELSTPAD